MPESQSPAPTALPAGVVAVLTDEGGGVIASAADFDQTRYSGMTLQHTQRLRVQQALAWAFVRVSCTPKFAAVLTDPEAMRLMHQLCGDHGCRVSIIPVNHQENVE